MSSPLNFAEIERLTGYQLGIFDVACPECGPGRREPQNRTRKVLRIWRREPDFASYTCARCGLEGSARRVSCEAVSRLTISPPAKAKRHGLSDLALQAAKAAAMWRQRRPAAGTPVETYLRQARGYGGPLPATIGFLPPSRPDHHPAMIAAFGLATEPEPGELAIDDATVRGIHLTLLKPNGSGKADVQPNKLMVGPSSGLPIVLAPPNDLLGLAVCEGIETGLSILEATGLGVWAAGAAGRMPALADAVPAWIDCVTIAAEPDSAGRKGAAGLAERLKARGIHYETRILTEKARAA